jgi:ribosomal protein S12 methylthiotransferase
MTAAKIGFISLGCPKALVDSERILTQLRSDGYEIVPSYEAADLVVVNTCGFIESARAESLEAIGEAVACNGRVIVTGCLGAAGDNIRSTHPGVLSISGPQQYQQVLAAVREHAPNPPRPDPDRELVPPQGIKLTPGHYSYLKIAEGCNHKCSFCIIPSMRGRLVSRSPGDILQEAQRLVDAGVKELLVIAQDTSAYGVDLKYRIGFWGGRPVRANLTGLCRALAELGVWVRLHYVYPYPQVDEIIPLMAQGGILPYLDIPLQHGSPAVLKAMRRPAAAQDTLARIRTWRGICPDLVIRSSFIVGFPGETEADFETLLAFLQEAQLDRVGCFQYSPVAGAAANSLDGMVPDEVKQQRWHRFMQVQARISARRLRDRVGTTLEVIVDGVDGDNITCRSHGDAPEIDGNVFISTGSDARPGDIIPVRITHSDEYDLWGERTV